MLYDPFEGHRFPREVILPAGRWYCRFFLSYQKVSDPLAERGITMDRATVFRWVRTLGPGIAKRACARRSGRGLNWHVPLGTSLRNALTGPWTRPPDTARSSRT